MAEKNWNNWLIAVVLLLGGCVGMEEGDVMIYNVSGIYNNPATQQHASKWALVIKNDTLLDIGEEQTIMNKYIVGERVNAKNGFIYPHFGGLVEVNSNAYGLMGFPQVGTPEDTIVGAITLALGDPNLNAQLDTMNYALIKLPAASQLKAQIQERLQHESHARKQRLINAFTVGPQIGFNRLDLHYLDIGLPANFSVLTSDLIDEHWKGALDTRFIVTHSKVLQNH